MSYTAINILIGSRIRLFAEGLKRLLEDEEDFRIIGLACRDGDLVKMLRLSPDIIITDHVMFKTLFSDVACKVEAKVLFVSDCPYFSSDDGDLRDLVSQGLAGILSNDSSAELLKKAIFSVYSGDLWMNHKTIQNSFRSNRDEQIRAGLTKREKEILRHLCSGLTNGEIARKLFISEQTVKSHCNRLYKKIGVSGKVKLALCASQIAARYLET